MFSMRHLAFTALALALPSSRAASVEAWTPLLDEKLTRWETYLAVPHASVVIPGYTHAADPKKSPPLGLNHDPLHVFTVRLIDGEPVLHVTGQIFGLLSTRQDYGDFHLRVQFRWGTVKHPPRATQLRDNGILYHAYGPHGANGGVWKRSLECQVQEGDIGDFYSLGNTAEIAATEYPNPNPNAVAKTIFRYTPGAPLRRIAGRCSHGPDYHESPSGEWNTIEVMAVGDRSLHLLNGRIVNVLEKARRPVDGQPPAPLLTGQIHLQSEGAEADYRRVEIRPLTAFPDEYQKLFTAPTSPLSP